MSCQTYPSLGQGIECAKDALAIYQAGEVQEKKAEFACHCWNVAGVGLSLSLGDPHAKFAAEDCPDDCSALEDLAAALKEDECQAALCGTYGADDDKEAIDPSAILLLVKLVVDLINWWKNRKDK